MTCNWRSCLGMPNSTTSENLKPKSLFERLVSLSLKDTFLAGRYFSPRPFVFSLSTWRGASSTNSQAYETGNATLACVTSLAVESREL